MELTPCHSFVARDSKYFIVEKSNESHKKVLENQTKNQFPIDLECISELGRENNSIQALARHFLTHLRSFSLSYHSATQCFVSKEKNGCVIKVFPCVSATDSLARSLFFFIASFFIIETVRCQVFDRGRIYSTVYFAVCAIWIKCCVLHQRFDCSCFDRLG